MSNTNRLNKSATYRSLHRLLVELIDGKTTLIERELNSIVVRLTSNPLDPLNHLLWLIASYAPPTQELIAQAQRLIAPYKILSDQGIYSFALPEALQYLLKNPGADLTMSAELLRGGPPLLRRALAEFLINAGKISDGLWLMLDILETVGTDHTTADNILLNFIEKGTAEIKKKLLAEAKNCDASGHRTRAENARWLASSISANTQD